MQGKEAVIKNVLVYNKSLGKPSKDREIIEDKSTKKIEIENKIGFQEL